MNAARRLVGVKLLVILGFAFTAFGLTLGLATYVVPMWYIYTPLSLVSNPTLWEQLVRNRGIFQECSEKRLTATIDSRYIIKNDCYEMDVGQYNSMSTSDLSYSMIIRLRQSQLILQGISLVFALVILLVGLGIVLKWCGAQIDSTYYIKWRLFLGLVSFLIFLVMSASPAIGTVIIYFENMKEYQTPLLPYMERNLPVTLKYSTMYILAWVSSGFYLLASIFFLISVCLGSNLEEQKYKPQIISVDNPSFSGDDGKSNYPIFLQPSTGSTFGTGHSYAAPNDTISPGLLPRYKIGDK